jgi:hypothetical protein
MPAQTYPKAVSTPQTQDATSLSSSRGVAILIKVPADGEASDPS